MYVAGFDFGQVGAAYSILEGSQWPPVLSALVYCYSDIVPHQACDAEQLVFDMFENVVRDNRIEAYVLEEQGRENPKTCMMEAALRGMLRMRGNCDVMRAHPKTVGSMFGHTSGTDSHDFRKADAVAVVDDMVSDPTKLTVADSTVLKDFYRCPRKHDMADALLLAYWHLANIWHKTYTPVDGATVNDHKRKRKTKTKSKKAAKVEMRN
jgi:hypothetical protein